MRLDASLPVELAATLAVRFVRSAYPEQLDRDEHDEREVPWLEASRFAREEGLIFVEVSAMTGEGVDQPFLLLARSICARSMLDYHH